MTLSRNMVIKDAAGEDSVGMRNMLLGTRRMQIFVT